MKSNLLDSSVLTSFFAIISWEKWKEKLDLEHKSVTAPKQIKFIAKSSARDRKLYDAFLRGSHCAITDSAWHFASSSPFCENPPKPTDVWEIKPSQIKSKHPFIVWPKITAMLSVGCEKENKSYIKATGMSSISAGVYMKVCLLYVYAKMFSALISILLPIYAIWVCVYQHFMLSSNMAIQNLELWVALI